MPSPPFANAADAGKTTLTPPPAQDYKTLSRVQPFVATLPPERWRLIQRPPRNARSIWLAYVRLEDPPGLSPITTVGRYATVEEAQVATDEAWAAR